MKRIVHLGLGRFHRAHQAYYIEKYNQLHPDDLWQITAVSLRTLKSVNELKEQDFCYSIISHNNQKSSLIEISSIKEAYFLQEDFDLILNQLIDSKTHMITLTVTEKGYSYDFLKNELNLNDSQIQADLKNPQKPSTTIGLLALALEDRSKQNYPMSIISCDNISHNGDVLKKSLLQYIDKSFPEIKDWVIKNVSFPNSMVDRIVPALSECRLESLNEDFNLHEKSLIETEGFSQWVIEDNFASDKPLLESVGVQIVQDVDLFEQMKLRLLNGTHTILSFLGPVKNHTYVHQAMNDLYIQEVVDCYMNTEAKPSLEIEDKIYLEKYIKSLIERFKNPHLNHSLLQIANDGSQKIPQRWLPILKSFHKKKKYPKSILIGIASWLVLLKKSISNQDLNKFDDPMKDKFQAILKDIPLRNLSSSLKQMPEVFPSFISFYQDEIQSQIEDL